VEDWIEWVKGRATILLLSLALGGWGIAAWLGRPLHPAPGVLVPEEPLQGPVSDEAPWEFRGNRVVPLAEFEIRARVLSVERYRWDQGAKLCSVDLALGWGRMSDSVVLDRITITQSDRWYHWRTASFPPIPMDEISSHSANMHMIPATPGIERILTNIRVGQIVNLKGKLVRVEGPGGFRWNSSTTRTDTGDGSCELVWVEQAGL
jgi:hypothetical protein